MSKRTRAPTHPGIVVRDDVLPSLGLSVTRAASLLGVSRAYLYRLLDGAVPMSVEMCLRIGKLAGNGPRLWMNMQAAHSLWQAEHDRKTMRMIEKIPNYASC